MSVRARLASLTCMSTMTAPPLLPTNSMDESALARVAAEGFSITSLPSIASLTAPTGPLQGRPLFMRAAEMALIAMAAQSTSWSVLCRAAATCRRLCESGHACEETRLPSQRLICWRVGSVDVI